MEPERREKILHVTDKIANALVEAQRTLWTLSAIHHHSRESPSIDEARPVVMDQIWRGLFDRLYMKVGSVIENSKPAGNLNYLKSLVLEEKNIDPEAYNAITQAFERLEEFEEFRQWRNKTIAHNDLDFDANLFYEKHKRHVSSYQPILDELYIVLNTVSYHVLQTMYGKPAEAEYQQFLLDAGALYAINEVRK